jgi:hypothetical protein
MPASSGAGRSGTDKQLIMLLFCAGHFCCPEKIYRQKWNPICGFYFCYRDF